jgi:phosphoribosylformimino-5-aminoimidazole carboxamide ribotide isomerase
VDLYPAIDLRAGRAVRLYQGDYSQETVYGTDPVAVARSFAAAGARWIHVVDLDAARSGVAENRGVVASIAGAVHPSVAVQSGGGVRSADAADALMSAGVARVVLGTAALESPDLVAELASRMPVAVGLDVRGREVAIHGWTAGSGADVLDVVRRFEDVGVEAVSVTQIARDGTLSGPDVEGLSAVLEVTSLAVIASGGVGSLADLESLASLSAAGRTLAGAIVGKALYEGRFTVEQALAVL